jgi:hypothetical protein
VKPETLTWQLFASPPPESVPPPEELDELPPLPPPLLLPELELLPASGAGVFELLEEHATATAPARDAAIRPNDRLFDIRSLLQSAFGPHARGRGASYRHPHTTGALCPGTSR